MYFFNVLSSTPLLTGSVESIAGKQWKILLYERFILPLSLPTFKGK